MNTPELPEHMELCAAAAAGSIDPVDRQKFAEHLAEGCDDCDATLPAYERATVLLAAALPLSAPASSVRDRVLQVASGVAPMPTIVAFPVGGNAPRAAQSKSKKSAGSTGVAYVFRAKKSFPKVNPLDGAASMTAADSNGTTYYNSNGKGLMAKAAVFTPTNKLIVVIPSGQIGRAHV